MARELPSSARRVQARERQAKALELRLGGVSTAKIAHALGVSRTTAWRSINRALDELVHEVRDQAEQLRAVQAARIEADLADLWPRARAGDMAAYRVIVRLYERQGRLLGIDRERPPDEDDRPAQINVIFSIEEAIKDAAGGVIDGEYVEQPQIGAGDDAPSAGGEGA